MIISVRREFVFIHIHKCAGTSIESALEPYLGYNDILLGSTSFGEKSQNLFSNIIALNKHSSALDVRNFLGAREWERNFTFAFVRHPVERLFSLYKFSKRMAKSNPLDRREKEVFDKEGRFPSRIPFWYSSVKAVFKSTSFSEFVCQEDTWRDPGSQPQWTSVCDEDGNQLVNYIGKVESIEHDWENVCQRIGIEVPRLETLNTSEPIESDIELTDEAVSILADKFKKDAELFEYRLFPDE